MVWVPPTVADFDARYPEFASKDRYLVEGELADAIADVTPGDWIESDRTPAVLALTAHRLASSATVSTTVTGGTGIPAGAVIKARTVGDTKTEFAYPGDGSTGSVNSSGNSFDDTPYGQRYYRLLKLNFPAFRSLNVCQG